MPERSLTSASVRFGAFEVSPDTAELRKNGVRLQLSGQAIQVLLILLKVPGQLVGREELQQELWPRASFGDFDHGLNAAVNRLREVLGDSATNSKFIETVPRRGYRFIGQIQPQPSARPQPNAIEPQGSGLHASPDDLIARGSENGTDGAVVRKVRPAPWRRVLPGASLAVIGVVWVLVMGRSSPTTTLAPAPLRLSVELGADGTLPTGNTNFALSHDGRRLAFVARGPRGVTQLHVRDLDQVTARPLDGTDGASSPFFSPDGHWVAFFAEMNPTAAIPC
jgi:DNA-binding winged helix-turn-helix (wHTH) protein